MGNLKTVLGFDFGTRYIGIAIGQTITMTAEACSSLRAYQGVPKWPEVTRLIHFWKPDALIVGVPVHLSGESHAMTVAARQFILELNKRFSMPVHAAEERLTSVEARARLFAKGGYHSLSKKAIDGLSAQLIVEGWLTEGSLYQ